MIRDLDHLVFAVPDLAAAVDDLTRRAGVTPARGGSHTGLGTANVLVGLRGAEAGDAAYLEVVGPDPAQPAPAQPRPFGIDDLAGPRLVTWAIHPVDVDAVTATAREQGYDPGDAFAMSRRTPDGDTLHWRLTPARGVVPFLIDWGPTPHPTTRDLPTVDLVSVTLAHPDPAAARHDLTALGLDLPVAPADAPTLTAVLATPAGRITL